MVCVLVMTVQFPKQFHRFWSFDHIEVMKRWKNWGNSTSLSHVDLPLLRPATPEVVASRPELESFGLGMCQESEPFQGEKTSGFCWGIWSKTWFFRELWRRKCSGQTEVSEILFLSLQALIASWRACCFPCIPNDFKRRDRHLSRPSVWNFRGFTTRPLTFVFDPCLLLPENDVCLLTPRHIFLLNSFCHPKQKRVKLGGWGVALTRCLRKCWPRTASSFILTSHTTPLEQRTRAKEFRGGRRLLNDILQWRTWLSLSFDFELTNHGHSSKGLLGLLNSKGSQITTYMILIDIVYLKDLVIGDILLIIFI